ncbi:hypothetical protein WLW86_24970, partial [Bordetella bronchiseptica]
YAIALVDLDEGFRLMVNVRGGAGAPRAHGARGRRVFVARGAGAEALFWWRRGAWVYAVIGALPEAALRPLAQRLADAPLVHE